MTIEHDEDWLYQHDAFSNPLTARLCKAYHEHMKANEAVPKKKPQAKKKPKSKAANRLELPEWMPAELWKGYVSARRSMKNKHPMSNSALMLAVMAVQRCINAGYSVDDILLTMTENGWRTVRPDWMAKQGFRPAGPVVEADNPHKERGKRLADKMRQQAEQGQSIEHKRQ